MKKTLFIAAIIAFFGGVYTFAGDGRGTPSGDNSNPIPADYAGVDYWGTTFSNFVTTVALPAVGQSPAGTYGNWASTTTPNGKNWVVYGAFFSTGNCGSFDFIEVSQSTGGYVATTSSMTLRFYNVYGSTGGTNANNQACSGATYLRWPIHMKGSIFMKPSSNAYNQQGILYYREPD